MSWIRHPLTLLCCALMPMQAWSQEYSIRVTDNQLPGQTLYVAVYKDTQQDWETAPYQELKFDLPESAEASYPLNLPSGRYALRAYVDLNDNQLLDTHPSGRPQEPFASSVGTDRRRPSPSFRKSVLVLSERNPVITLQLRYPKGSLPDEL